MASIVVRLGELNFADIDTNLGKVRDAIQAGQQIGTDGLDPLTLLGDLGPVIKAVQELDADPQVLTQLGKAALAALGELIELPELGDLDGIITGITELAELIGRLVAVLSADGTTEADLIDRILTSGGGSVGLSDLVNDITRRAADVLGVRVPDELAAPFRALERLATGGQIAVGDLAEILGTVVVGLDLGDIGRLVTTARGAVELVAGAGDIARLDVAITAVQARVEAVYASLTAGGAIPLDVAAVVAEINRIGVALDALAGVELPRFVDGLATDLRTVHNQLSELDITATLTQLYEKLPLPGEDIPRIMVKSLKDLADMFDQLTGEALTAGLAVARAELGGALGQGQFATLLAEIDEAFAALGREVDRLPLRALRDRLIDALVEAQQQILAFDGFAFLDEVTAPVRTLETKVRDLDLSVITDAVEGVVDTVNDAFADFPVTELKEAVEAVLGPLGEIVEDLTPLVQTVAEQLESLAGELEAVDFEAAGAATLDLLHGIRTQVQDAVSGGDVPEAVKIMIAGAAAVLKELDLAAAVTGPFEQNVIAIDVEALLEPVEEVWTVAGDALRRATPEALIAELDPPFDELLDKLDELSLQPLIAALGKLFDDLVKKLGAADPRKLVAPLEQEFQALLATLRAALDPAPLFAPLREAYAALRALLDKLDVETVINSVVHGLIGLPDGIAQSVGGQLKAKGPSAPPLPAATGEFRFGDVLRPMAAFVGEIRDRIKKFAHDTLGAALAELATATRGLRALADPVTGFATQLADALDTRLRMVDPRAGDGPLARLRTTLEALGGAVATLEIDASARAQLTTATASVQFDVRIEVTVSGDLTTHADQLRASAEGPELGRAVRLLVRSLDAALPDALLGGGVDSVANVDAFLDAVFARIDPTPLATELDAIGDRIQTRLVALADQLTIGLFTMWNELFTSIEVLRPDNIIVRVQAGLDSLFGRVDVFDPAAIEDEARAVVAAAVSLLAVHSPAKLAAELGRVFDAAMAKVGELDPEELLGDLDPFGELKDQLKLLRPSVVLAPLAEQAAGFTAALTTIADIDLSFLTEIVARVKATFAAVLDGVETEWNSLLDELGRISGGVSVSGSVG